MATPIVKETVGFFALELVSVIAAIQSTGNPWRDDVLHLPIVERQNQLARASAGHGEASTRLIVGALSDPELVPQVLAALSRRRNSETFDALVGLAGAQINRGGWETLYELYRYPYPQFKPDFERWWDASDGASRKIVTGALAWKALPDKFWTLISRTRDPNPDVAWEVAANLWRYKEERYQRALMALLDHPDARVQARVALGLGMGNVQFARKALERKAQYGPQEVRWPATEALSRLNSH